MNKLQYYLGKVKQLVETRYTEVTNMINDIKVNQSSGEIPDVTQGHIQINSSDDLYKLTTSNAIYDITNEIDLGGQSINIPSNCILEFKGGKFINGCINGDKQCPTIIHYDGIDAIFDNVYLTNMKEVRASWILGVDTNINNLFKYLKMDEKDESHTIIYFDDKQYVCSVRNFIIINKILRGVGRDKTVISITPHPDTDKTAWGEFLIGIGYGTELYDLTLRLESNDYEVDLARWSNDNNFFPKDYNPTGAYMGLILNNISFQTKWCAADTTTEHPYTYKACGLHIKMDSESISGDNNKCVSMSYIRNLKNLQFKYFHVGLRITVIDRKNNPSRKIWCNSLLFDNIEAWAHHGIEFITDGIDSDTGYFVFQNYMYQGHASGCGYWTNNGSRNSIINYIPWDTDVICYVGSGHLYIPYLSKDYANRIECANGAQVMTNFGTSELVTYTSLYDSYYGTGRMSISPEVYENVHTKENENSINLYPETTKKSSFIFKTGNLPKNSTNHLMNSSMEVKNINGSAILKNMYIDHTINGVRSIEQAFDVYDGNNYASILYSSPRMQVSPESFASFMLRYLPYNTIMINWIITGIELQGNSCYRIHISPKDKEGNTCPWAQQVFDGNKQISGYTDICVIPSGNINYRNGGVGFNIINSQLVKDAGNSFIDIETHDHTITSIPLTIIITSNYRVTNYNNILRTDMYNLICDKTTLMYSKCGNTASRPSHGNIYNGFCYYDTNLKKPIYSNNSEWLDSNGVVV